MEKEITKICWHLGDPGPFLLSVTTGQKCLHRSGLWPGVLARPERSAAGLPANPRRTLGASDSDWLPPTSTPDQILAPGLRAAPFHPPHSQQYLEQRGHVPRPAQASHLTVPHGNATPPAHPAAQA